MTDSGVKSCRYVATAGMFDGVHRGHQFLLRQLAAEAHRRGLQPLVFTFSRHPLEIIAPQRAPKLLTTPGQRIDLIRELSGIEHVELLDPTPEFLMLWESTIQQHKLSGKALSYIFVDHFLYSLYNESNKWSNPFVRKL